MEANVFGLSFGQLMEGVEGAEAESSPVQGFSLLNVSEAPDTGNGVFIPFWI